MIVCDGRGQGRQAGGIVQGGVWQEFRVGHGRAEGHARGLCMGYCF